MRKQGGAPNGKQRNHCRLGSKAALCLPGVIVPAGELETRVMLRHELRRDKLAPDEEAYLAP